MTRRNRVPDSVSMETQQARKAEEKRRRELVIGDHPSISARDPARSGARPASLPEALASRLPTGASRDAARMVLHGLARTGNTILKAIDIPNRVFGNSRSLLQDIYEKSEENLARDAYEDRSGAPQVGEAAVHLASAGVLGKALPAVFGANVGADTYETAKYAGASEGEALAKGVGHGVVDTAIWTLGQGLSSKLLPKAWQWLGRTITGAGRGAASSVTSDAVLNSLGADIGGDEMAKRAVHAAWMVPLLGMLKMGGKRREEAMSILRKARPDLAGAKAEEVIDVLENEFSDRNSQVTALQWVARKGANLPDDLASIKGAIEAYGRAQDAVKAIPHMRKELNGLVAEPPKADPRDEAKRQARIERLTRNLEAAEKLNEDFSSGPSLMKRSPFEIISNENYARFLPRPNPKDVKAFSNMKRYPMGVIGFDVSDDAAGRQATREMINAYMSPSSNPWCLATGKGAKKLGELGPGAENFWKMHSAVPKQIFFQDMEGDGNLALIAFRATGRGGEGWMEYWDTSDAPYSGIPIRVKVPGDPLGRYQKLVFRPASQQAPDTVRLTPGGHVEYNEEQLREYIAGRRHLLERYQANPDDYRPGAAQSVLRDIRLAEHGLYTLAKRKQGSADGEVQGTFEDVAPGKVFKGDPFRDGRSQTWVEADLNRRPSDLSFWDTDDGRSGLYRDYLEGRVTRDEALRRLSEQLDAMDEFGDNRGLEHDIDLIKNVRVEDIEGVSTPEDWGSKGRYILVEDKVRTTENGITKFRTTKYPSPTDLDYNPPKPGEQPKPYEIEESELVSPEWMRAHGYDPENESDVSRMQQELDIQEYGNGVEAAMAVVPTRRTVMETKSGTPETVVYGPNGRDVASVDFTKDGVPYREEYFESLPDVGYADPSYLYHTFDPDSFPRPSVAYSQNMMSPTGLRLVRNPDSASPEVLNEIRWDKGLGGYVRTSGNRRWYLARTAVPEDPGQNDLNVFMTNQQVETALREGRLNEHQAREINHLLNDAWWDDDYLVSFNSTTGEITPGGGALARMHHRGTGFYERLLVEDRQPDGTWAPVTDRGTDATDRGTDATTWYPAEPQPPMELPPPPPEIEIPETVMDAKGGNARMDFRGGRTLGGGNGGRTAVKRNGNLKIEGRRRMLIRDDQGRVEKYGTTGSVTVYDPQSKSYVVIPTIVDGKRLSPRDAFRHYRDTGEFWHRAPTIREASQAAGEVRSESLNHGDVWWRNYLADHYDDGTLSPGLRDGLAGDAVFQAWRNGYGSGDIPRMDPGWADSELRQDALGGDAGMAAGEPQEDGPRIVINPSVFEDDKDALCVAFNEAFRIVMEMNGFEPQSEPTEAQRRFFADTPYANDELQLRRTILARICTFDTSIS